MRYAKKVVYVPYTGNDFLSSLDQKMSKILSQKIPVDEKVKLYNQTLETYLVNVPEKTDPKVHLHDEDRQFLSEKPVKLDLKDKQFLAQKVNRAVRTIKKHIEPKRAQEEAEEIVKARPKLVKPKKNIVVLPLVDSDDEEPQRRVVSRSNTSKSSKQPTGIDLGNIVTGQRQRMPKQNQYSDQLRKDVLLKNVANEWSVPNLNQTTYEDANSSINQTGQGWISNKNYFK